MAPETVFSICSTLASLGWLILLILPGWYAADKIIIGIIITLFSCLYAYYLTSNLSLFNLRSFSTLKAVTDLFSNPMAVLIGWIHYLAFDLMAGLFIKHNGQRHGIRHWLLVPCYLFTFLFGPLGLLLYFIIRLLSTKQYFSENY